MRTFRLALAQVNPTVGDLEGNTSKIIRYTEEARALGADLVAFSELVITGYPPEDLVLKPPFIRDNLKALHKVVEASHGLTLVVGFVDRQDNEIYNAAALARNGVLVGVYHKLHLPNYGVFDEDRYFKPGNVCPVYTIDGFNVGVNICEDIWYADGPTMVQREAGAELIVNINGSPYHAGKRRFRQQMLATRASDNELFVAYVNAVGGQDELVFDGGSMVFDQNGSLVARSQQFEEELLVVDLDIDAVFRQRLRDPRPRKQMSALLQPISQGEKTFVSGYTPKERLPVPCNDAAPLDDVGEVYHALVIGTRDYVRKNGFQKILLGLSGGIDSSLTCCIATDALGSENVVGVAMPSRYSSEGSILDAQALANNLGVELWTIPINPVHTAFEEMLEPMFRGMQSGVAEQNVQSRIRGNTLMSLSNKFGWLVLTTGNKSETAMGYSTLYGDIAGGFAVLKDVHKMLVYRLAEWRDSHGQPGSPIPRSVFEKPPSAELAPNQRDDDDLPPYAVLDQVLEAYVEEEHSLEEIVAKGVEPEIVKRIIRTVDRNEYKRRQSPVGIKITPRAFGRDRRMPIINRYPGF